MKADARFDPEAASKAARRGRVSGSSRVSQGCEPALRDR